MRLATSHSNSGRITRYEIDGREVSKKEFERAQASLSSKINQLVGPKSQRRTGPGGTPPSCYPMTSAALLTLNPETQRKIHEDAKAKGVHVEFDKRGEVVMNDRNHRKQVCEYFHMTDRNAGYMDRVGNNLNDGL